MRRFAIITFIICFAAIAYAQQAGVAAYDVLMRSAKIYLSTDPERAKMLLDSAVNNYPEQPEARYWLGTIYHDKADYKNMMLQFNKFDEIYARAKAEKDKKTLRGCERDDAPKQISTYKASALSKSFQDGVTQLKLADSLSRESASLSDDTARANQEKLVMQLFSKAKELLNECLMIDDTVAAVYTNLGLVEAKQGNKEAALELYRKAYGLAPTNSELMFTMAQAHYGLQHWDSAATYFGLFADADSLNREGALINQALCYQSLQDYEKMKLTLDRIITFSQQNGDVFYQRGMYYILRANSQALSDSAMYLDSLSNARPNDKSIEQARTDLMAFRVSMYKQALPDFKAAAELSKTDADYWYWYGTSAVLSEATADAKIAYEKCVEISPDNKDCWCQLAITYAKLKMQKEFDDATAKCNAK